MGGKIHTRSPYWHRGLCDVGHRGADLRLVKLAANATSHREYLLMCSVWIVDYLIKPRPFLHEQRPGAAAAILIIYFILLLLVASTYFRLLYTVASNPGYIKRGLGYYSKKTAESNSRYTLGSRRGLTADSPREKNNSAWGNTANDDRYPTGYAYPPGPLAIGRPTAESESPGLEQFYSKDVFVCEGDGRPIWCSKCMNWKPDRTHHCREVDRCVRKMDHFCPW